MTRSPDERWYVALPIALIVAQIAFRAWLIATTWFKQDDFVYMYRLDQGGLGWSVLGVRYDGHFMPGSLVLTDLLHDIDRGGWWQFALAAVLMQLAASVLVWRLLDRLFGRRPLTLVLLLVHLASIVTLPAYTWWSAAMQHLPLQIGIPAVLLLLVRALESPSPRAQALPAVALACCLLFFERALMVPVFATLLCAATPLCPTMRGPWHRRLRAAAVPLGAMYAVSAVYLGAYLAAPATIDIPLRLDVEEIVRIFPDVAVSNFFAALFGLRHVSGGMAHAVGSSSERGLSFAAALLTLVGLVIVSALRRAAWLRFWVVLAVMLLLESMIMSTGRVDTAFPGLRFEMRYVSLMLTPAVVLLGCALAGTRASDPDRPGWSTRTSVISRSYGLTAAMAVGTIVVILATFATASITDVVRPAPAQAYVREAERSLEEIGTPLALLPEPVPDEVIWGLAFPFNSTEVVFSVLDLPVRFPSSVDELHTVTATGDITRGLVTPGSRAAGSGRPCLAEVESGGIAEIPLSNAPFVWDWTIEIEYESSMDGFVALALDGEPTTVATPAAATQAYFRVVGGGPTVTVVHGGGGGVCITGLKLGVVEPVDP